MRRLLGGALCALLFVAWTAERPRELDGALYRGLWRSPFQVLGPFFVSVPPLNLSAWQILLAVLAFLCVAWPGCLRRRGWTMETAIGVSILSVALGFAWGGIRGGSAYNAYYQIWRFLAGLLVAFILLSAVRTSRQLKLVGLTVVLAALVRGTLAMYFYWAHVHGQVDPPPPYMTTHDDSLLWVAGIIVAVSWAVMRGRGTTWVMAMLVCTHLLYAIALNRRRLAWIELLLAVVPGYLLLPAGRVRRRLTAAVLLAAPVLALYVLVGRDRPGVLFEPLRALSTSGSYADSSSLARLEEIRNLLYTLWVGGNPLLGTGWGMQYQKVTSVYANYGKEWWQYAYLPHNSLLGIAVFSGLLGIFATSHVLSVAAFLATRGCRDGRHAVDRAAAMAAACVLPAYGVQCYGDIGFQSLPAAMILGVALGVAGTAARLAESGAGPITPRAGHARAVSSDGATSVR